MTAKVYRHEFTQCLYVVLIGMALALTSLTRAIADAKSDWRPPREGTPGVCMPHGNPHEPAVKQVCEPLKAGEPNEWLNQLLTSAVAPGTGSLRNHGKSPAGVLNPVHP